MPSGLRQLKARLLTPVVINLRERAGDRATHTFEAIRHKYRDWLANLRNKGETSVIPTYVFAFENPTDLPHVNWVVHIPKGLEAEFARKLRRWVLRAQGEVGPFDVNIQPVTLESTATLAKYILKGTQETHIDHFHLGTVYDGPQGSIWGKRAGSSPSIGKTARERAGFKRRAHRSAYRSPSISSLPGSRLAGQSALSPLPA